MFRAALLTILLSVVASAQPAGGWTLAVRDQTLPALAALMDEHPWPALHAAPAPLALSLHERIRHEEDVRSLTIEARLQVYADLAKRIRKSGGYSNYVLADALNLLSIHHIARRLVSSPAQSDRALSELEMFIFALPESTTLSDTPDDPVPTAQPTTGGLLRHRVPTALMERLAESRTLGEKTVPALIAELRKNARLEDLADPVLGALIRDLQAPDCPLLIQALDVPPTASRNAAIRETILGPLPGEQVLDESPDGRHYHFVQKTPFGEQMVVDGTAQKMFERIDRASIIFGFGSQIAYVGHSAKCDTIMLNGRELKTATEINALTFTTDGKRLAYMTRRAGRWYVFNGMTEEGPFDAADTAHGIAFSPDGKVIAYAAELPRRLFVTGPGVMVEYPAQQLAAKPWFSADGRRIALLEEFPQVSVNRLTVVDLESARVVQYVDGAHFLLSSDLTLVQATPPVAGKERVTFAREATLAVAAAAEEGDRFVIRRDKTEIHEFPVTVVRPGRLTFAPGGEHLAYTGPGARTLTALCVDGQTLAYYDSLPPAAQIHWDAPNRFHVMAVRYGEIVRAEVTLK